MSIHDQRVLTLAATLGVLEAKLASIKDEFLARLIDAASILFIVIPDGGSGNQDPKGGMTFGTVR